MKEAAVREVGATMTNAALRCGGLEIAARVASDAHGGGAGDANLAVAPALPRHPLDGVIAIVAIVDEGLVEALAVALAAGVLDKKA